MIKVNFTEEGIEKLRYERFNHPHPRVQLKVEALLLKSQFLEHQKICEIMGISHGTLTTYLRKYQEHGIEGLKELNFYSPQSKLENYRKTLEEEFKEHPPATIKKAMVRIKEITGIKRSETQVSKFLKKKRVKTFESIAHPSQS